MFKLTAAGKRYLENAQTSGRVWFKGQRINLATATQEQLELLWNNGKGSLVEKAKTTPPPASTSKASDKEEKSAKKEEKGEKK